MSNLLDALQRFWSRVRKTDACWIWTGRIEQHPRHGGYGRFDYDNRGWLAHRFAYEHAVGPIPDGCELDHKCRTRACVRPDHLDPVPHVVNMRRGARATKTHCPHGHEYTPENTRVYTKRGSRERMCKACVVARREARRTA